jgi:hypothetical protein
MKTQRMETNLTVVKLNSLLLKMVFVFMSSKICQKLRNQIIKVIMVIVFISI